MYIFFSKTQENYVSLYFTFSLKFNISADKCTINLGPFTITYWNHVIFWEKNNALLAILWSCPFSFNFYNSVDNILSSILVYH
jgi:hypothetical protein